MLTRIDLRHFKCFKMLKLPLRPLTLLSGGNAAGKSSVIQALGLLHQTMREHEWSQRLMLNGSAVRLGTVADVVDQVHGSRECAIELLDTETSYRWRFSGEREDMTMAISLVGVDRDEQRDPVRLRNLLPASHENGPLAHCIRGLTYLTAERLGPREQYQLLDPHRVSLVGRQGEYAVSVLHSGRDLRVLEGLVVAGVPPTRLQQVQERMAQLFPGCVLAIDRVPRVNAVTLGLRTSPDTDFLRPVHTGFGLTQALPIVVAALSADRGDLLLIENPEVHLHPAGQAQMGQFLAAAAAAGVQVLVETHSDHLLNGVRRSVKDGTLASEAAALHFFRPRQTEGVAAEPQVLSPTIDPEGNIDTWPDGFFDQFDKDMNYFAGWS